jgi:hypothetical protein
MLANHTHYTMPAKVTASALVAEHLLVQHIFAEIVI